jgi:hypothetical protein
MQKNLNYLFYSIHKGARVSSGRIDSMSCRK